MSASPLLSLPEDLLALVVSEVVQGARTGYAAPAAACACP